MRAHNKDKTKMSSSDNHSHKEEKTDPSVPKKQSENEGEKEAGNVDQIDAKFSELHIKEPTPPSDRDQIRVKFLINVPVGVTPEMSEKAESHCQKILDLLREAAFSKKDERRYEDIAVVFGLNGNESDKDAIEREFNKPIDSEIAFEKFDFTWPDNDIPYRKIRETIKNHEHTRDFVKQFRTDNLECIVYFCFFDADTVDFNHVLSSYIDVIHEHKYPTVMSTGYVFPEDSENREKSERDRQVRIITAEHFPLGTYYPEANFCVLLPLGEDTLPERFDRKNKKSKNNMESPNLITQVKTREGFKAVFADKDPVVTSPIGGQFHTNPRTWAICAYAHKELEFTDEYKRERFGRAYDKDKRVANREYTSVLMRLLTEDNPEMENLMKKKPFKEHSAEIFEAALNVRDYLNGI